MFLRDLDLKIYLSMTGTTVLYQNSAMNCAGKSESFTNYIPTLHPKQMCKTNQLHF